MNKLIPDIDVHDSARKAALLFHAMGDSDRSWILAHLSDVQAGTLKAYASELMQLGIPKDTRLMKSLLEHKPKLAEHDSVEDPIVHMIRVIDRYSGKQIFELVSGEPLALVSSLFALYPWAWRDSVLSKFDAVSKNQIKTDSAMKINSQMSNLTSATANKYQRSLLTELSERLSVIERMSSIDSELNFEPAL